MKTVVLNALAFCLVGSSCSPVAQTDRVPQWVSCDTAVCPTFVRPERTLTDLSDWQGDFPFDADLAGLEPAVVVESARGSCSDCVVLVWMVERTSDEWRSDGDGSSLPVRVTAVGIDSTGIEQVAAVTEGSLRVVVTDEGLRRAQAMGTSASPWTFGPYSYEIDLTRQ